MIIEDFRGIPYFIYEFCKSIVQDEVDELIRSMGWSLYNVMFLFSIVARGLQYDFSAHALDADYVTHPIRWLGPSWELALNPQKRAELVPLGSIVAAAWLESQYNDFDVLATYIGKIRERAIAYNELWEGKITKYKEIEEVERSLVEGILPGRLSDTVLSKLRRYSAVLGALIAAAVGDVPGAVTGISASWYLNKWVDLLNEFQVSPSIAGKPFVRSYINYPRLEHLGYAICSRCGTETITHTCPVCDWQERKDIPQSH